MNHRANTQSQRKRGRPVNEARRDEIIQIAAQLFMRQGFRATTMEQIAKALGISKLTLYSRFKNKDALFSALIQAKCQEYIPDHFFAEFHTRPLEDSLYHIASGLLRLITSDDVSGMERVLMEEGIHHPKMMRLFYEAGPQRVFKLIAAHLQQLHEKGELHVPDPMFSTHAFAALIKGSQIYMRLHMHIPPKPTKAEIEQYCRDAVKLFIKAH